MTPLLVLVFAAAVAAAVALGVRHHRRTNLAWRDAAHQLGLRYLPGGLFRSRSIAGSLHGLSVRVDTYSQGDGKTQVTYTRYRVRYPSLGLGLRVKRQGALAGIARWFGAQDIEVGDPAFDRQVVVKGASTARVTEFLTPARRDVLQRLLRSHRGSRVTDRELRYAHSGVPHSADRIASTVRRLVGFAQVLTGDEAAQAPLQDALAARRAGRLDDAVAALAPDAAPAAAPDLQAGVQRGEMLYAGGRFREAAAEFDRLRREVPDEPEVEAWSERAHRAAAPPAAPAPAAAAPADVELREICGALFDGNALGFESTRLFEERYQGRGVRWTGVLRRVEGYLSDMVFGGDPGTRALCEVYTLEGHVYGTHTVQAVLQLPPDELDRLRPRLGETLAFTGTLARCDPYMRNLFVAGAQLE